MRSEFGANLAMVEHVEQRSASTVWHEARSSAAVRRFYRRRELTERLCWCASLALIAVAAWFVL